MKNIKKIVKSEKDEVVLKHSGNKPSICFRLDLGKIKDGLYLDLIVHNGEDPDRFMVLGINDEPISIYDMEWYEDGLPENNIYFPGNALRYMGATLLGERIK